MPPLLILGGGDSAPPPRAGHSIAQYSTVQYSIVLVLTLVFLS